MTETVRYACPDRITLQPRNSSMKRQTIQAALLSGVALVSLTTASAGAAQFGPVPSAWRQHEMDRPRPPVVAPPAQPLPTPAPPDAVILFDGRDLSGWTGGGGPAAWTVRDGYMEVVPDAGSIQSREEFGDVHLHVEWASPNPPVGSNQDRGNSGIMLMGGRYEIQVLDTYQANTYADGMAGAIYGQYPPLFNASRAPGEWQAYEIYFRRPRFGPGGTLVEPARVTVVHNGILVQNNEILYGPTTYMQTTPFSAHADQGPIQLQDHDHRVRFRNIWARRLPERPAPPAAYFPQPASLTSAQLDRLAGVYARPGANGQIAADAAPAYTITRSGNDLMVRIGTNAPQRAIATSPNTLWLTVTGATMTFDGGTAPAAQVTWEMGGATSTARRRP